MFLQNQTENTEKMFRAERNQQKKRKAIFLEIPCLPNCSNPPRKQSPFLKLPENRLVFIYISCTIVWQQHYCSIPNPAA